MRTRWIILAAGLATATNAQMAVLSTQPSLNANNVARGASIVVNFDRAVDPATFTGRNFYAFARWSGIVQGTLAFSNGNTRVTFTPARPLSAGDRVMLIMSHNLKGMDNTPLRAAGYTLSFTVAASPTPGTFCSRMIFSDRSAGGAVTRIYGGLACDLNRDGAPDLTLINEDSGDLRVFLNLANGSGLFGPMLTPPTPIPFESSPNKPADFDGDGFVDIVTSSNLTNQVAVVRGHGDGTFGTPTLIDVGGYPRGIGILDADGDGDMDVAVACRDADAVYLLLNDGAGNFAAPVIIQAGGDGAYGLAAADMNNDGIMDLVVGHTFSQTVSVLRGNGDGTFTFAFSRPLGGQNWVINCGDVNNDGFMDVSAANSGSNNASILKGNGDGTLQAASVMPNGGHTTGTDLIDIDGDGDLDWIVSAYGANRWYLYRNNGAGVFALLQEFPAPGNPACSVAADFDNDGDIDLILLDETTDLILLMINTPVACVANCDCSAIAPALNVQDFACFLNRFAAGDPYANCDGSTVAPVLNVQDFACYLNRFAAGCS
jgi:hypothetical protein